MKTLLTREHTTLITHSRPTKDIPASSRIRTSVPITGVFVQLTEFEGCCYAKASKKGRLWERYHRISIPEYCPTVKEPDIFHFFTKSSRQKNSKNSIACSFLFLQYNACLRFFVGLTAATLFCPDTTRERERERERYILRVSIHTQKRERERERFVCTYKGGFFFSLVEKEDVYIPVDDDAEQRRSHGATSRSPSIVRKTRNVHRLVKERSIR